MSLIFQSFAMWKNQYTTMLNFFFYYSSKPGSQVGILNYWNWSIEFWSITSLKLQIVTTWSRTVQAAFNLQRQHIFPKFYSTIFHCQARWIAVETLLETGSFSADDLFSYSVMPYLADYPLAILFQTVFSHTIDYCCEATSPPNTLIQATYATFLG